MSNENSPSNDPKQSTQENKTALPPAVTLWLEVANSSSTSGQAVREIVIGELTNQEIVKRKDAVLIILNQYDNKTKELKKSEKTLAKMEYDASGQVVRTYYDADGNKTLKELREEISNLSQALGDFFNNNDTKKLYEISARALQDVSKKAEAVAKKADEFKKA